MKIMINAKGLEITEGMKNRVYKKLSFLEKYLKEHDDVQILIEKEKREVRVKVLVPTINNEVIVIQNKDKDFYSCIDVLSEKVKETYLQNRGKYLHNKKKGYNLTLDANLIFEGNDDIENEETDDVVFAHDGYNPVLDLKYD